MRHTFRLPALLVLVMMILSACTGELAFPGATVEAVTPSEVGTAGGEVTIEGTNFFQYEGGARTRIEACGVSVPGRIVDAAVQTILLPPGDRVRVEAGTTLTVTLPGEGLEPGVSDLRIVRPDGAETIIEGALTCADATAPDALAAVITASTTRGPAPLTVDFDAAESTGEGDLAYAWEFGNGHTSTTADSRQTFSTVGDHTVTLTVTDESGETDTTSTTITVTDGAPTARAALHLEPFWPEGSDEAGAAPSYMLTFDGTASTDPNGDDLTYTFTHTWSGRGEDTAEGAVVELPAAAPADSRFVLTLTVADPQGNSDAVTLHTLLDPYGDDYGSPFPFLEPQQATQDPDLMRLTWYDADEGGVVLEVETAEEHPILEPGDAVACDAGLDSRLAPQQGTEPYLAGSVGLGTDGDPATGVRMGGGMPSADFMIWMLARNEDGTFPIIDPLVQDVCEVTPLYDASVAQDGTVLTFGLPEGLIGDADLLDPGMFVHALESLDGPVTMPTDSAPDADWVL